MPSVLLLGKILKWSRETPQLPRPGPGLTWVVASRIFLTSVVNRKMMQNSCFLQQLEQNRVSVVVSKKFNTD